MYIYHSAIAKEKGSKSRWHDTSLDDVTLAEIYEKYEGAYLVLSHSSFIDPEKRLTLNLSAVRTSQLFNVETISEWLTSNGEASLPTEEGSVSVESKHVHYGDAWRAGYDMRIVAPGAHPDVDLPESMVTDLLLTHDDVDYRTLYRRSLVSVNGMIHQTSYSEHGLYVTGGALSGKIANNTQVGILSFNDISDIEQVPITSGMVYCPHEDGSLAESTYVKLNKDLTGKNVFLVLGGYLQMMDETYSQVGEDIFKIDFKRIPLPQRLLESKDLIDIDSLELTVTPVNDKQIAVEDIYDDDSLRRYLCLSQSFFVIIDEPEIYVDQHLLESTHLPGRYVTEIYPNHLLRRGDGQLLDYIGFPEDGKYSIACDSSAINRYNYYTTKWRELNSLDATRYSYEPTVLGRAMFLEIGKDTLI